MQEHVVPSDWSRWSCVYQETAVVLQPAGPGFSFCVGGSFLCWSLRFLSVLPWVSSMCSGLLPSRKFSIPVPPVGASSHLFQVPSVQVLQTGWVNQLWPKSLFLTTLWWTKTKKHGINIGSNICANIWTHECNKNWCFVDVVNINALYNHQYFHRQLGTGQRFTLSFVDDY